MFAVRVASVEWRVAKIEEYFRERPLVRGFRAPNGAVRRLAV